MNPVEKFLKEKRANPTIPPRPGFLSSFSQGMGNLSGTLGGAVAQGIGTALAGAGVATLGVAAHKIYDAMTKRRDFQNMLEANPDLMEAHQNDPKIFNRMFTSLRLMNPSFSADPVVAGTYMRRMVESPMTAGGVAVDALSHHDPALSPVLDAFQRGGIEGAKGALKPRKE